MNKERLEGRVRNLLEAWKKTKARLEEAPDDPRAGKWERQIEEYETSMLNIKKYGREEPPTAAASGVEIDVPVGDFKVREAD